MVKILSVIQNIEQNSQLCQYLTQDNNIDFKITSDEVSVLKQYYDFRPDIFILDTSFKNIKYSDVINELSLDDTEQFKCNTILLYNSTTELLNLANWSKIYNIFLKTTDYKNILKAIYEMSNYTLFNTVGKELGTTGEGIRSSFRTALKPLNEFKDKEDLPFAIYKFFPKGEEVTPKLFLDISIYYLKNTKK